MMDKIVIIGILVGIFVGFTFAYLHSETAVPDRDKLLTEIQLGIEHEINEGNYRCCIDPPCDMCYLGHWIWDDGSCKCDDMIMQGELDKVCPQCKKGIENGFCKSSAVDKCAVLDDS